MAGSSPSGSPRNSFISEYGSFDIGDTKVQMSGLLVKKPFGGKKGKKGSWQKRYVIINGVQTERVCRTSYFNTGSLLQKTAFFFIMPSQSVEPSKKTATLTFILR